MNSLPILVPTLQIGFYQRLIDAQNTYLLPALFSHVSTLQINRLDNELFEFVKNEKLGFLARKGIRGELVFPVPYLLSTKPQLLGYYRLLLGFSQKEFYKKDFQRFMSFESKNAISTTNADWIGPLCTSLIESSWILINGIPNLSIDLLNSLSLLTLGPQFRGSRNVNLGIEANSIVFALIKSFIATRIQREGDSFFEVLSTAGRIYRIEFSPDPDIAIRQVLQDGSIRNRIAIEIKGGTDFSNIHNRLGEAEKSHQKAKNEGFTQFWTVINVANIVSSIWKNETPTTNELFYLDQISDPSANEHLRFKEYLVSELGI